MNTKHLLITFLLFFFQSVNSQNKTETNEHTSFLKEFYTEYISNWDNPKTDDMIILEKYCTTNLLGKIHEMHEKLQIGYDPFIFAQDISPIILNYLQVKKYGKQENLYEVSFRYPNDDDNERTRIKLRVINTDKGCKINAVGVLKGD